MFRIKKKERELELKYLTEIRDLNNQIIELQKKLVKKDKALRSKSTTLDSLQRAHTVLIMKNLELRSECKSLEQKSSMGASGVAMFAGGLVVSAEGLLKRVLELEKSLDEALDAAIEVKEGDAFKMNVATAEDGLKLQQVLFSNGFSWNCGSKKAVLRSGMYVFNGEKLYCVLERDVKLYNKCPHKELTMREFDEIYKLKK